MSDTQPTTSTASTSLNPAINPLSSLALHHADSPAVSIVLDPLDGTNFIAWSHAVKRALSVKNKVPLIDGSVPQPLETEDRAIQLAWTRANDLVLMWIMNSINPDIKKILQYFTTAKAVWDELHIRYAQSDDTRVYQLEKLLSAISQNSESLVSYYNKFKTIWDEWLSYRPVLSCNCGALSKCSCNLLILLAKTQEKDALMKFLIGLDESYSVVRSQILMNKPMPPLAQVYSLLLQEESQRNLHNPVKSSTSDPMAMLAKNTNYGRFSKEKKKVTCSNCDGTGHTVDKCFQLIGYPPGWKGPRTIKNKGDKQDKQANVSVSHASNGSNNGQDDKPVAANPLFNQELFEQFLSFTKLQKENEGHSVAAAITLPESTTGGGQDNQDYDWYC